jgi:hypothetical protein
LIQLFKRRNASGDIDKCNDADADVDVEVDIDVDGGRER